MKALPVEKSETRNSLYRRFDIGNTLDRPVIEHALDDVSIVAVHPVGKLVCPFWKTLRRGLGAEGAYGSKIAVQSIAIRHVPVPAVEIDIAVGIDILSQQNLEGIVRKAGVGKVDRDFGIDRNNLRPVCNEKRANQCDRSDGDN